MGISEEHDRVIAEWMGAKWLHYEGPEEPMYSFLVMPKDLDFFRGAISIDTYRVVSKPIGRIKLSWVTKYSESLDTMASALAVVKERGLGVAFGKALADVLAIDKLVLPDSAVDYLAQIVFAVATASAAQQAEALVRAIANLGL